MVPAFMVQPLVENAVRHAMPQEGKLEIHILAYSEGDDLYIAVSDNGVGMDAEQRRSLEGLGYRNEEHQRALARLFRH